MTRFQSNQVQHDESFWEFPQRPVRMWNDETVRRLAVHERTGDEEGEEEQGGEGSANASGPLIGLGLPAPHWTFRPEKMDLFHSIRRKTLPLRDLDSKEKILRLVVVLQKSDLGIDGLYDALNIAARHVFKMDLDWILMDQNFGRLYWEGEPPAPATPSM